MILPPNTIDTPTGHKFCGGGGSRRLVGADEYRNTANSDTGLRGDVLADRLTATAIYVLPQQRRPDDAASLQSNAVALDREGFDLLLWGATIARAKIRGSLMAEASFYHLGERDMPGHPTRDRSLDTWGGRLIRDPATGKPDGEVEAFYLSGTISASTTPGAARLPVSAWFIHAAAGYSFHGPLKARLALQYDRASGDHGGSSYGRFDTLYGMRWTDLAPAGLDSAVGRANISTPGLRFKVTRYGWPHARTVSRPPAFVMPAAAQEPSQATSSMHAFAGGSSRPD